MAVKIFCCYAHEDEALLKELKMHLRPLQREGLVDVWYDRDISAGTDWEHQIKEQLNTAQIILLLVSPDFMDSDYCYGTEMKRALERHEGGEARVIPVIVRPVYFEGTPFSKLQALPTDAKPVMSSDWQYKDEAFVNVIKGIRKVVGEVMPRPSPPSPERPNELSNTEPIPPLASVLKQQPVKPEPLVTTEDISWLCIRTLTGHKGAIVSVAISPDGQTLASSSTDTTIKLWNLKTGDLLRTLKTSNLLRTITLNENTVRSVAISPDGQTLASGSEDKMIKLWNLKSGDLLRTLTGHENVVDSVAISPDGQTLASGSIDHTIKLWNLKTGNLLRTLGHQGTVFSVAISPDGQTLASGSSNYTIKLWKKT